MNKTELGHLPHAPGVYLMRDAAARILYIGKAKDLRKRVSHYFRPEGLEPKVRALMTNVRHIDFIPAGSEREALVVEQRLIKRRQPLYNALWKDDKSYPFLRLSLNEDFPRLALTRRRKRDGALYFGPYPNVSSVRKLLHWAWKKKLFPLRPCDFEFSEGRPLDPKKIQSCLYYHTGECPAPCAGRITKKDYAQIAQRARLFFEGRNDALLKKWEAEMKAASAEMDFERAAGLRDNIEALRHIREPVAFRALREEDVQGRLEGSMAVQALQTELGLTRPPMRIEAFDVSHIQGSETVASLVVFEGGKPKKSDYRKFIIRTVKGVDDFASLAEAVGRRYRRVRDEKLPWPDLILIDGGPGQLSAAAGALEKLGPLPRVSLASLAKEHEEIYLKGRRDPFRLSRASSALQLLQRARDEAHRFAVEFHRLRRGTKYRGG